MFEAGPGGFTGGMNAKKYQAITRCSKATATRDLQELTEMKALRREGEGRATRYVLPF
jgi:Fic family protein